MAYRYRDDARVIQLPNGKWTHRKTVCEFDDKISALNDWRFCCGWEKQEEEGIPSD